MNIKSTLPFKESYIFLQQFSIDLLIDTPIGTIPHGALPSLFYI
jgi:hypothetical protein